MEQMTVRDVVKATGGKLLCGDGETPLVQISINSQTMEGGDLFVPLIGAKVDAHRFIGQAFDNGAAATLTSRHDTMADTRPWIRVEDTKKALQDLGAFYRRRFTLPLVGITGSVGKTTTREMVAAALSAGFRVYKTKKNLNSQVGVPITLCGIASEDEIGVLELGMSEPGELTVIARIANVDMAVITNVGVTHIEQLGSQENIFREKMTIQDGLKDGGILLLNGDDERLKTALAKKGCRTVYYGSGEHCDYRCEDIRIEGGYPVFTAVHGERRIPVRLGIMGRHHVLNAMVALAAADLYGIPMEAAAEKIKEFSGFQNRQQIYENHGLTIIDDTYNASPASMEAGLEVLNSMVNAVRRIAVLADMKELGPQAQKFHREVGRYIAAHPVDMVFTLGGLAEEILKGIREAGGDCICCGFDGDDKDRLKEMLDMELAAGDCVLLKGSNSMKLGEVAAHLIHAWKPAGQDGQAMEDRQE